MRNIPGSTNMPHLYPVLWLVTPQWGRCVKGPSTPGLVERSPKQRMQNYEEAARSSPHLTSCSCCFCTSSRPRRCPALPCRPLLICWQTCGDIRDGEELVFPQLRSSPLKVAHPCRRRLCMFCQTSSRERGSDADCNERPCLSQSQLPTPCCAAECEI